MFVFLVKDRKTVWGLSYGNVNHLNIKFTTNYGGAQVDLRIYELKLRTVMFYTSGYRKATDTNAFESSNFPPPMCEAISSL